MPDENIESVFKTAFNDSVRMAFVITRSLTDGAVELQLYNRDEGIKPRYAGQFTWNALAKLFEAMTLDQPGSILVPAYTQADILAYVESGETPPGFRNAQL